MKMKKVIIGFIFYFFATISILTHFYKLKINNEKFIFSLFLLSLLSSCAIDRKCPAYSRLTDSAFFYPS